MFEIGEIEMRHATELKNSEVAFLSVFGGDPVVVAPIGDKLAAIRLDQDEADPGWVYVESLYGVAIVVPNVVFEIDPQGVSEERSVGDLMRSRKGLSFITSGPVSHIQAQIAELTDAGHDRNYFVKKWRAVSVRGEERRIIFERRASEKSVGSKDQ